MLSNPLDIFPSKEIKVVDEMGCINDWMAMVKAGNPNARMDHALLRYGERTHVNQGTN